MTTAHKAEVARISRAWERLQNSLDAVDQAKDDLDNALVNGRAEGMTLQAMGDVLGLTRQRVKQMLDKETS